jgi:hypothetical protein
MPQHTSYRYSNSDSLGRYETSISCRDCGESVSILHDSRVMIPRSDEADATFRFHSGNGRYLGRCRTCERAHVRNWRQNRSVPVSAIASGEALHGERRFGVEMETVFLNGQNRQSVAAALRAAGLRGWNVKSDCSINGGTGAEIVSPPLRGENGRRQLRTACEVLARLGAKVNRSCGLHVHHGVSDLTIDDFKRMVRGWVANQRITNRFVSPSRRGNRYAAAWSEGEVAEIDAAQTLDDLSRRTAYRVTRYKTLNVSCFPRFGTVEIRQHQGTIDYDKIVAWLEYGQAIIDASKTEELQSLTTSERLFDRLGGLLSEQSKTFLRQREQHFAGAVA